MKKVNTGYKKNFGLLVSSVIFITALFLVSVLLARSTVRNNVTSDFNNRKVEVYDESIVLFNEFFDKRIPEISYYQGYMDADLAAEYANQVLRRYPFVEDMVFYDIVLANNDSIPTGVKFNNLLIHLKSIHTFFLDEEFRFKKKKIPEEQSKEYIDDFNNTALKLVSFLDRVDETTRLTDNEIFKVFYSINPGKIAYMNIPRLSDLTAYKDLMIRGDMPETSYDQDMMVFNIDPQKIKIINKYPNLYESIEIVPIVEGTLQESPVYMQTDLLLPGVLSEYKLQFDTSELFISKEINRKFVPVVLVLCFLYLVLLLIVYLIFRNVTTNSKLYALQYDFINNLTHEFKTPVSVIKIAGNNIKSAKELSRQEQDLYGKILDQEADKLNNLMNTLLSFTQIENKSIRFKGEEVDIKEFGEQIFSANKLKYTDMKISYSIDVQRKLYADPVLLGSVFQNLIDNAYKYSEINNKTLDVKIFQNKRNFVFIFRDKGIGIDKKELGKVFNKFYRVKNQFNQQGSIGLGLAFCKEITEFMGGEIKVSSEVGVGTTFTLTFPLNFKN
ncbi:MAG TPA: HAMP domain-containing sensor histidine kinase [Candidatus Sphingobacterium stercoripullorum]|uniref:histidine kinase n=1 Tax=Candidatus Sphingobacterium stercoripullorum TaxID=2838759 RepID=A0A9D1WAU4_9SPHI|nr:HAMP domain-containing histidine kinase [Candidatus Sphingobacterium stercoripullorum]HLR51076.1 HAMP domain-containing sensor histidine kinase [Candidatus Sphingobacterium stercoripullorum]